MWNLCKQVRPPVTLFRSLSGKFPYPPSYWLTSITTVLLGEWFWHQNSTKVDMPLNKERKLLYSHNHNIDFRTSMNERTHFFIKIYISPTLFSKGLMFLWCVRDGWRDIYSERGLLLPISSSMSQGCQCLHPLASSSETPPIGYVSLTRLRFSALCLNLTAWFSSRCLLPVSHLLYPTALIVLSSSSLLIKIWQLAKAHGVTWNEPKIHVICYTTEP